ncbi:hypothetical protein PLICRDRAFT_100500 [Plicaturopsis crispa FD-325 SS-3]|nr:hypothetical protein PLICRDRAFT_100500 [Plicaturopsis crispa FD-325 SS-3]
MKEAYQDSEGPYEEEEAYEEEEEEEEDESGHIIPKVDDTTATGHMIWRHQRKHLYYMRLIEHEMPKLVAFRKPFVAPTASTPLVVRSIEYVGEEHPASAKRTIVVPVANLPLRDKDAIHKLKLLAGVRWTPDPPKNAGIGRDEAAREHGYVHISCEHFSKPAQNIKWASDALDRLISHANDTTDKFKNVPLDTRHLDAKTRKARKGDHAYGGPRTRPSIRDFPKEWLPQTPQESLPTA